MSGKRFDFFANSNIFPLEPFSWSRSKLPEKFLVDHDFSIFLLEKIKVVQNCMKWQENWLKTIFGFFNPPLKKRYLKKIVNTKKNESCSKLRGMRRKLVENDFWIFSLPPPQKNIVCKNMKKSKLFKSSHIRH